MSIEHFFLKLQFRTSIAAFVGELTRYCQQNWMPGWKKASVRKVRFRDGEPTWGEDEVVGVFFHRVQPVGGQLRALPLSDDPVPDVFFLMSDIGGDDPLLVKMWPRNPDAISFVKDFAARCKTLWKSASPSEEEAPSTIDMMARLELMHSDLTDGFSTLRRGQDFIVRRIDTQAQSMVRAIKQEIQQGRIEQGDMERSVEAVRLALRQIQHTGLAGAGSRILEELAGIRHALERDIGLTEKLELAVPVIPLLLNYKVEVGASADLATVWEELKRRVQKGSVDE
jgi:hypothetical protein